MPGATIKVNEALLTLFEWNENIYTKQYSWSALSKKYAVIIYFNGILL
jgi:hypothetical protein